MTNSVEQKKHLEEFLMSDDLEELKNLTGHFNIFNALKLQNNEIRHSNFLSWLMEPYESHKIGDYFLKEFLKSALKRFSLNKNIDSEINEIVFADFNDAEIRREYKNIDILVISPKNKFLYVIENKIWTGEHDCQLERYAQIVNSEFGNYKKLYIYLSPANDDTCDLLDRKYDDKSIFYIPMSYTQVNEVLDKILKFKNMNISSEVALFIKHYKQMIERNIMGKYDKDVLELCSRIYKLYGSTIDLIVQQGNPKSCVLSVLEEVLNERNDLIDVKRKKDGFLFLPDNINNKEYLTDDCNNSVIHLNCWGYAWNMDGLFLEVLIGSGKNKFKINSNEKKSLIQHITAEMNKNINDEIYFIRENEEHTPSRKLYSILTHEEYLSCENREDMKQKIKTNLENSGYINALRESLNAWNPKK